eukprot:5949449-Prorocentrum_lima.AAC.1
MPIKQIKVTNNNDDIDNLDNTEKISEDVPEQIPAENIGTEPMGQDKHPSEIEDTQETAETTE